MSFRPKTGKRTPETRVAIFGLITTRPKARPIMQAKSFAPYSLIPSGRLRGVVSFVMGALLAASFAPLNAWPLAVLCPAVLIWLWEGAKPREAAWLGFWFNAGTFAAGTYWLYISIHVFGEAPIW